MPYEAVQCRGWKAVAAAAPAEPRSAPRAAALAGAARAPWEPATQLQSLPTPSHSCDQGGSAQKPRPCWGVTCSGASVSAAGGGEPCLGESQLPCAPALLWGPQID